LLFCKYLRQFTSENNFLLTHLVFLFIILFESVRHKIAYFFNDFFNVNLYNLQIQLKSNLTKVFLQKKFNIKREKLIKIIFQTAETATTMNFVSSFLIEWSQMFLCGFVRIQEFHYAPCKIGMF
jgi:hypothetical protein